MCISIYVIEWCSAAMKKGVCVVAMMMPEVPCMEVKVIVFNVLRLSSRETGGVL